MMCCIGTESNKNPDQVSGTLLNLAECSNGQMECVIGKQQAWPLFLRLSVRPLVTLFPLSGKRMLSYHSLHKVPCNM